MIRKKTYFIRFETNLNASMKLTVKASSWHAAMKKVKKEFPSADIYERFILDP